MSNNKFGGQVQDREKPIYLLVTEDCTAKEGVSYYESNDLTESANYVEFRGLLLTKANADKLIKEPYATIKNAKEANRKLPWHKIIRIDNLNYKKPRPQ